MISSTRAVLIPCIINPSLNYLDGHSLPYSGFPHAPCSLYKNDTISLPVVHSLLCPRIPQRFVCEFWMRPHSWPIRIELRLAPLCETTFLDVVPLLSLLSVGVLTILTHRTAVRQLVPSVNHLWWKYSVHNYCVSNASSFKHFLDQPT